ncbi:MAG: hypothetical protein ABI378_08160 [Chitinophagaceae bacterium]
MDATVGSGARNTDGGEFICSDSWRLLSLTWRQTCRAHNEGGGAGFSGIATKLSDGCL